MASERQTEAGFGWYWGEGKTAGSRRTIPLSAPLVEDVKRHKEFQSINAAHYDPKYKDLDLVFRMPKGAPINSDVLGSKYFKPVLEKAGLPSSIRLYDLRHSMATLLLLAGVNPKIVSERLGHASVTMTLDVYSHVLPTMQQAATNKLECLLWKSDKQLTNRSGNEKGSADATTPLTPLLMPIRDNWEAGILIQPRQGSH